MNFDNQSPITPLRNPVKIKSSISSTSSTNFSTNDELSQQNSPMIQQKLFDGINFSDQQIDESSFNKFTDIDYPVGNSNYQNQYNNSSLLQDQSNLSRFDTMKHFNSHGNFKNFGQHQNKKQQDRFIPNRKYSKMNIAFTNNLASENAWIGSKENYYEKESQVSVSDIYKLHVLGLQPPMKKSELYPFINNNILKFGNENNYSNQNIPEIYQIDNILKKKKHFFEFDENVNNHLFKQSRKIAKVPYKVLDAPALQDDFYLNLIDWSQQNILAVGLSSSVYLWSADSSRVTKLCDLGMTDIVTSVQYNQEGSTLCIGTNSGDIQIWDTVKQKKVRTMTGHSARVGCISWCNQNILSSGSRDKSILHRDIRDQCDHYSKLQYHKQEVCGLKWSFDEQQLASGGNDNKLYVWNQHSNNPISKFSNHTAAIKAITWSQHQHGLLVSGGGTADRTIRFWNTLTNDLIREIDTGSQICNLMFSKNVNELVSTHGYSQNQIIVWKYPDMEKIITLTGHTYRVLYLAISPDGQTIVTGAGDETLRFWNIFPSNNQKNRTQIQDKSSLLPQNNYLR